MVTVRQVICTEEDPGALHLKTQYDGPTQSLNLNRRKWVSGDAVDVCNVQLMKGIPKPSIPELKKRDLISLCESQQIPSTYHDFYSSLPVGGEIEEEL